MEASPGGGNIPGSMVLERDELGIRSIGEVRDLAGPLQPGEGLYLSQESREQRGLGSRCHHLSYTGLF